MTTLTRPQLIEALAAANTNLAIATHEEQETWRIYDDNFEDKTNEVNQARFDVFAQKQNTRKEKWQAVDAIKAQLLERDEIAALLDTAKASLTIDRAKQFQHKYMMEESFQSWETWASDNGLEHAPHYQMCKIANRIAAGVFAGQIVNHL